MIRITKVYIVTECPYVGVFKAIVGLSKELKNLGFDIVYVLPQSSRNRYGETQKEHEVILSGYGEVSHVPLRRKTRYMLGDVLSLRKYFKGKSDIVISYTEYAGKVCRITRAIGGIRNLYHAPQCVGIKRKQGLSRLYEYFFEKILAPCADYYLSCSPSESYVLNNTYHVHPNKIILISNYLSGPHLSRPDKYDYDYIYVGRIIKNKGVVSLLRIFKMLGVLEKTILVGDGDQLLSLKLAYPNVQFTGRVIPLVVDEHLKRAKFFVSNSVVEGMPYSLLEAMSLGVVPIVSKIDGHDDIIIDGHNGFMFEGEIELINTLFKVNLLSPEKYQQMSEAAVSTIERLSAVAKENIRSHFETYE